MKNVNRFAIVPALLLAAGSSAMAAMPTGVEAAIADLSTNAVTVATTVLLAVVAVFAIKFIRKGL